MEDYYDLLGVSPDATEEEITRAYREQAAKWHPDVSDDPDAEQRFKQLQAAKEVLTDDQKRAAYDRMGHERFKQADKKRAFGGDGPGAGSGAGRGPGGGTGQGPFGDAGHEDPFGGGGDPFRAGGPIEDLFEQFFGRATRGRRRSRASGAGGGRSGGRGRARSGEDLRASLTIDLETAAKGVTRELTVDRPTRCSTCEGTGRHPDDRVQTCPRCDGRGRITHIHQSARGRVRNRRPCDRCDGTGQTAERGCPDCDGAGRVETAERLSVTIPAGIADGDTLRLSGKGAPAPDPAGDPGDLLIDIGVTDHPTLDRDGADLHTTVELPYATAVLGGTVEVPTVGGTTTLEVPPRTGGGHTLRVEGAGMPHPDGAGRGDLVVQTAVAVPDPGDLTPEERRTIESLGRTGGEGSTPPGDPNRV